MVHLFVIYGYQGTEEYAEKLQLTGKLLQAVLAVAGVVCKPVLIAWNLNADPAVIPCLAKAISAGRFVDVALAFSLGEGSGLLLPASSSWMSVLVLVGISSWVVLMRLLPPLLAGLLIGGFLLIFLCFQLLVLRFGRLRFPALLSPSLCGPPAGLTLLIGHLLLYLVLFRMPGMCTGMNLVLCLLSCYWSPGCGV